jgi:hypothetical protein
VIEYDRSMDLVVDLEMKVGNHTYGIHYDGNSRHIVHADSDFNFTLISDTSRPFVVPDFTVFDITEPTDFWILPSNHVNSINDFDVRKIGWAKHTSTGFHLPPTLSEDIHVSLAHQGRGLRPCNGAKAKFDFPWTATGTFLEKELTSFLSYKVAKGSVLHDSEFPDTYSNDFATPNEPQLHSVYMHNGWMIVDPIQQEIGFGIVDENSPVITDPATSSSGCNDLISVIGGTLFGNIFIGASTPTDLSLNSATCGHEVLTDIEGNVIDAWLIKKNQHIGFHFTFPGQPDPTLWKPFSFRGYSFPSGRPAEFNVTEDGFKTYLDPVPDTFHAIEMPVKTGALEMAVQFRNQKIVFESDVISPVFEEGSVQVEPTRIKFKARSNSVGGNCVLGTEPSVTTPQTISLGVNFADYHVDAVTDGNYSGSIIIRCHQKVALAPFKGLLKNNTETDVSAPVSALAQSNLDNPVRFGLNPLNSVHIIRAGYGTHKKGLKVSKLQVLGAFLWVALFTILGVCLLAVLVKIAMWVKRRRSSSGAWRSLS